MGLIPKKESIYFDAPLNQIKKCRMEVGPHAAVPLCSQKQKKLFGGGDDGLQLIPKIVFVYHTGGVRTHPGKETPELVIPEDALPEIH